MKLQARSQIELAQRASRGVARAMYFERRRESRRAADPVRELDFADEE
jgi:hypothetical protein